MRRRWWVIVWVLGVTLAASACSGRLDNNPVLVEDVELVPTVAVLPSATPLPTATSTPTLPPPTSDFRAETAVALVTPTLPPSRTPTQTWTPSNTPTITLTPSNTLPPTTTPLPSPTPFPTQAFVPPPVTTPVGQTGAGLPPVSGGNAPPGAVNNGGGCVYPWFFASRTPAGCPATSAAQVQAAYLDFEGGTMIWTANDRMITVIYHDGGTPAWERYADTFVEGMLERDPALVGPQGLWQQPRRGFGNLWRNTPSVRARLGWALREWEEGYTTTMQQGGAEGGGSLYLTQPDGQVYELTGDRSRWERFVP